MSIRNDHDTSFWRSPAGIVFVIFATAIVAYLLLEHRAHVFGAWPLLFLIVCAGMHLFMHRGHGGGGHDGH
jgi:hypothetical protein